MKEQIISFPRMGNYHIPIQRLLRTLFPGQTVQPAPIMTQKTLELGCRYSPDFVCSPFQYSLGNFIEALEDGATTLIQTGMGCLFGYYGELQEQILRGLPYDFNFYCFARWNARPDALLRTLREMGCPLPLPQIARAFTLACKSIRILDRFEFNMREHLGFEQQPGSYETLHRNLLRELEEAESWASLEELEERYTRAARRIAPGFPSAEDTQRLRVGIVGELYTVMEPFSNFYLERELARLQIAVSRRMSLSFLLFERRAAQSLRRAGGYLKYTVGANGVDSVAQSLAYARQGYDGIIHMNAFGCTPEINAMPVLQKISRDYGIPLLQLDYDSHSSETGVQTRLEAFHDMLAMRKMNHV